MNIIEYIGVTKEYHGGVVVNDFSLEVAEGSFVVLMGSSGSGKTTLLKMANLLIEPSAGQVLFLGQDNHSIKVTQLRQQIGYVLQSAALFPHRTVAQNIETVPTILGWKRETIDQRTQELLTLVGLPFEQYAHRYPSQLSGGQQQRVGIARAMAAKPPVLLMDEPFTALDAIIRNKLQNELLEIHRTTDSTILFVTHDIDEAFRLGDKIAFLEEGTLLQCGSPKELLENPFNEHIEKMLSFLSVEAIEKAVSGNKGMTE